MYKKQWWRHILIINKSVHAYHPKCLVYEMVKTGAMQSCKQRNNKTQVWHNLRKSVMNWHFNITIRTSQAILNEQITPLKRGNHPMSFATTAVWMLCFHIWKTTIWGGLANSIPQQLSFLEPISDSNFKRMNQPMCWTGPLPPLFTEIPIDHWVSLVNTESISWGCVTNSNTQNLNKSYWFIYFCDHYCNQYDDFKSVHHQIIWS